MDRREKDSVREEPDVPRGTGGPYRDRWMREDPDYVEEPGRAAETEVVSSFSPARRAFEMIYLVFAVIDVLILIRILLKVLGANIGVPFTRFIYAATDPLLTPFRDLLPTVVSGKSIFEMSAVVAFIVYALLGYVLARLVAIMFMRNVMVSQSSRSRGYRPRVE
ncbi:MAG: YggT family protein [Chloroflexi bacterium]|nr:MAG: YggT family protein [Chloroflexota bacterium]